MAWKRVEPSAVFDQWQVGRIVLTSDLFPGGLVLTHPVVINRSGYSRDGKGIPVPTGLSIAPGDCAARVVTDWCRLHGRSPRGCRLEIQED